MWLAATLCHLSVSSPRTFATCSFRATSAFILATQQVRDPPVDEGATPAGGTSDGGRS